MLVFYVKNNSALLLISVILRHLQIFIASDKVNSDFPVILDESEFCVISSSSASLTCVYPAFFISSFNFTELILATSLHHLFPLRNFVSKKNIHNPILG